MTFISHNCVLQYKYLCILYIYYYASIAGDKVSNFLVFNLKKKLIFLKFFISTKIVERKTDRVNNIYLLDIIFDIIRY